jgi:hypothetical protein
VVDYFHLSPVRAKIVESALIKNYRWSSLPGLVKGQMWVVDEGWRGGERFGDSAVTAKIYEDNLIDVAKDEARWAERGIVGLGK